MVWHKITDVSQQSAALVVVIVMIFKTRTWFKQSLGSACPRKKALCKLDANECVVTVRNVSWVNYCAAN